MLENSYYKLKNSDSFTVGYFGGSITEGAGASDASKTSWRAKTAEWLQNRFPSCTIKPIQAAIGGTGSTLGVYRCENDLLKYNPDLVFYEFAVNDGGGDWFELINNCESIFRKIWAQNPAADIIVTYTTTKSASDEISSGKEFSSRNAHGAVSHYYGVPQIDMGEVLRAKVLSEGGDWGKYTVDTVHPNDDGYQIYTDCVTAFMENAFKPSEKLTDAELSRLAPTSKKLPAPLVTEKSRIGAHMEDAFGVCSDGGWTKTEKSLCGRYPRYIEALTPGAAFTYEFTGNCVGIYWMLAKDSGDIEFSIDGSEYRPMRSWDSYCLSFNRAGNVTLADNLPDGKHTLAVKVADSKAEQSDGNAVRIGAFLVS